ncbi:hypothetical protein N431DRAFT_358381 [Stipitochalara longipes BDJ]|nr:hypothetical protein N431DRAFT_358381 [Stipitochalara longipes BDJ]
MADKTLPTISNIAIGEAQRRIEERPTGPIEPPKASGAFELNQAIIDAFPVKGTKLVSAVNYGRSLISTTAKIVVELLDGTTEEYFLKVFSDDVGRNMCEGEYESLKAIHATSPNFVPKPYTWGKCRTLESDAYFLLEEFRNLKEQPAHPMSLATRVAELHQHSKSPTGKFGFPIKTCHGRIEQAVDQWDDSWAALFSRHLGHFISLAKAHFRWREFDIIASLIVEKVVLRLLLPLQENGRFLKPSLMHGDCWDGNTAMDEITGEAFVFDACSFYGHNEYDIGNWRAPRHRVSAKEYVDCYLKHCPQSEPVEEWDARNLLYSLTFNIGNAIYIPGSQQRFVVFEDMTTLCKIFCQDELEMALSL